MAGTIGRLCLAIFGLREDEPACASRSLADELGVALQLTNILRDVREDAEGGRVYLPARSCAASRAARGGPRRALAAAAGGGGRARGAAQREAFVALVRFEAARARDWFERGMELAPLLDRRSAACLLAMAGIYRRLLERIDAEPAAIARAGGCRCPRARRRWVAVRGMLGVPPRERASWS